MARWWELGIRVKSDVSEAKKGLLDLEISLNNLQKLAWGAAGSFGIAYGVYSLGQKLGDAARSAMEFNMVMERTQIGLTTMLGSSERAERIIDDLQKLARQTPYMFQDLIPQLQRMIAYGFNPDLIVGYMRIIGDAAAALGGQADAVDRIILALGQIQAKGRVMSQEMRQLAEAGIPVWKYLAQLLNTDVAGAIKAVEEGAVDAQSGIQAIMQGMQKDFGGMMEAATKTMSGAMVRLADNARQIGAAIAQPVFDAIRDAVVKFNEETMPQLRVDVERMMLSPDAKRALEYALRGEPILPPGPRGGGRMAGAVHVQQQVKDVKELNSEVGKLADEFSKWMAALSALEKEQKKATSVQEWEELAEAIGVARSQVELLNDELKKTLTMPWEYAVGAVAEKVHNMIPTDPMQVQWATQYLNSRAVWERDILQEQRQEQIKTAEEYGKKLQQAIEEAHEKARERLGDILFTPSQVTERDLRQTRLGIYMDKPDEYVRRLEAAAQDAQSPWRKLLIPEEIIAKGEDAIREYVDQQKDLYFAGLAPDKVNWDAVAREYQRQIEMEQGRERLISMAEQELRKRGINVVGTELAKIFKPEEASAEQLAKAFTQAFTTQDTMPKMTQALMESIKAHSEEIKAAGESFMTTVVSGAQKAAGKLRAALLDMLVPGVMEALQERGYLSGSAVP